MAQKVRDDKIGALSHSAGNIIMAATSSNPAYLTIGGQQYKITSQLSVALPSMTANTRYQVYAVQSAGVVSTVISTNENSVGPAGYLGWKLVGCLYSNGGPPNFVSTAATAIAFGSFVNITGVPQSGWISDNLIIGATTTPPTKATTRVNDDSRWMRRGSRIGRFWTYHHNTNTGATAGSGNYLYPLPTGFTLDTSVMPAGADINGRCMVGAGMTDSGGSYNAATAKAYDSGNLILTVDQESANTETAVSSGFAPMTQASQALGYIIHDLPISGLTDTAIEDL